MITLASVIERFASQFLAQYGAALRPDQRQALAAMRHCRSTLSTHMLARCDACDEERLLPHSCGHRNCPHCQHHESRRWIERQLKRQVPGEYFMLTFTLPSEFRQLAERNQRIVYDLLFECAWTTVQRFTYNDKRLQGNAGAVAVLHTHSRRLDYHPHVHLVMPAAAVDLKRRLWRVKTARHDGYLFNGKALAKVFRAKFLAACQRERLALPQHYPAQWVVHCKAVGNGSKALAYLGRYLYRGVIAERDILTMDDEQVHFRYRDSRTGKQTVRCVSGATFLWLVLQHVLPKGFIRARNFGFLHPNSKRLIALLQIVLKLSPRDLTSIIKPRPPIPCPCCGQPMRIVQRRIKSNIPAPVLPQRLNVEAAL